MINTRTSARPSALGNPEPIPKPIEGALHGAYFVVESAVELSAADTQAHGFLRWELMAALIPFDEKSFPFYSPR